METVETVETVETIEAEVVGTIETIEVDFADREGVKNPVLVGPFGGRKVVSNRNGGITGGLPVIQSTWSTLRP